MSHKPTDEQQAIIDACAGRGDLVIEAGAGTGKTSTLKMVAAQSGSRRGVYLAYNKSIATDAAREFPASVLCKTAHSLAYAAVGRTFSNRLRAPRLPARETARILGITEPLKLAADRAPFAPQQLARIVMETITNFCYSADEHLERRHTARVVGVDTPADRDALARYVTPLAQRAWDEDLTRIDGRLRFTHDCYLKLWTLSRPQLGADYVLLDEAQDSNPCVAGLVAVQDAQRILVGDRCQAIYGWRGAVDAMAGFTGDRFLLSQSFRFGQAVADEANKWLTVLGARMRLTGFDQIPSRLDDLPAADAVLCRTNAEAVKQVLAATRAGRRAALVGGGDDIRKLAEAAIDLQSGRGTSHPELYAFANWPEVLDYVQQDAAGADLTVAVRLIEDYGPEGVLAILAELVAEDRADVVISTAHKAKGREWNTVRVAEDFREPKASEDNPEPTIPRADAMLAYVSVTRAKLVLDRGGLAWVDNWVSTPATRQPPAVAASPAALEQPTTRTQDRFKPSHCYRCGGNPCRTCGPDEAAEWSSRCGLPAGPQLAGARS
jgi:hypothetical protein